MLALCRAAALLTGAILDLYGWRWAFIVPGAISIAIGIAWVLEL